MSQLSLLGLYQPLDSPIHKIAPGYKLLVLTMMSLAVVLVRKPWLSVGALALVLLVIAISRISWMPLWRSVRFLVIMLAFLGAFHWWQRGLEHAVAVVVGLFALILAAAVLTATTAIDDMLDTLVRGLGPFRRIGVNPESVGLAFSLLLRFIPDIAERAFETRQAAKARGLDRNVRAYMTPLTIRVVARAKTVGEALQARGIGDD